MWKRLLFSILFGFMFLQPTYATVSGTYTPVQLETDGVEDEYDFDFKVFATTDIRVYLVDETTLEATLQEISTDYTVTLIDSGESGGTVTFVSVPDDAQYVYILRSLTQTQATDIPRFGMFREQTIENMVDKNLMLIQELNEKTDRAVLQNPYSEYLPIIFPLPEADYIIGWDSTGTGLENKVALDADIQAACEAAQAAAEAAQAAAEAAQAAAEAVANDMQASILDTDEDTKIQTEESADEDILRFDTAGSQRAQIDSDGLTLSAGASVNEFSTDGTMVGNSDDAVPTEKATVTYVGTKTTWGAWVVKSSDYGAQQASTNGVVHVVLTAGASVSVGNAVGYTDGDADPATARGACNVMVATAVISQTSANNNDGFSMFVKAGDYWKVVLSSSGNAPTIEVHWIPTGG